MATSLVFSGGTSVQEYTGAPGGAPAVEYVRGSDYGGGVGGILYTLRSGTPSYTHENRRGDVVAKTNAAGSLTYQAQYAAFGQQVATSGSTQDRQKSNSKDTDPTGLVDEGFRYRDLETGMFITRDPAGFVDGPNLYTYVVQNPWTHFDPEGLDSEWHHDLPQEHEEQFKQFDVNIHDSKYGSFLPEKPHDDLHAKQYNEEWDKFFSKEENKPENIKNLSPSAKQARVDAYLETLKSDPRFESILKKGAAVPNGLSYEEYSKLTPLERSQIIQKSFSAKKWGTALKWGGEAAEGAAKFGKKFLGPLGVALTLGTSAAEAKESLAEGKNPKDVEQTAYYRNVSLTGQTPEEMQTSENNASQSFFNWISGSGWKTDAEKQQQESQDANQNK